MKDVVNAIHVLDCSNKLNKQGKPCWEFGVHRLFKFVSNLCLYNQWNVVSVSYLVWLGWVVKITSYVHVSRNFSDEKSGIAAFLKRFNILVELCLFRSLSCCLKFAEHFSWQNRSDSWKKPLEIDSRRKVLFTTCAKTIDLLRKWIQKFPEQKPWRCANVCYKKDPKSYAIKRDPCNEMETENKGAAQVIRPGEMFMYWILNI